MMILDIGIWFQTLIKQFFFSIDQIVFGFISTIYDLLISIARTSILTQSDIIEMAEKIYTLLTVFMVFKVTLSLITYVVNPDDFSDKSKGVSKLGINIIISLALLILTPYIFSMAYELQTIILEDNSLATLIFETETKQTDNNTSFINDAGDIIAYNAIAPFFTPNLAIKSLGNCFDLLDSNGKASQKCTGVKKSGNEYSVDTSASDAMSSLINNDKFEEDALINYVVGIDNRNIGLMFRLDMVAATAKYNGDTYFIMEYKYIFSTVVGVVIMLLLLNFCLDVAVRSVKLAFLQLIAPIPILSYVDPKSGKDGMFKKWYQMCFSTYLSLFIRLLALYFGTYIISKIDTMVDIIDGSTVSNWFIKLFVIIGALMFAKQFPKILEGLGLKLDGGTFNLNPLRKIEKEALGGGVLKKANDGLAKFAKGGFGLGTATKKFASGVNAAYHGKGFANGWARHKGAFGQWIDKQRETYTPYGHELRKERRQASESLARKENLYNKGKALYEDYSKKPDGLLGAFSSDEYAASYKNVADQKAEMYRWQNEVELKRAALYSAQMRGDEKEIAARKAEFDHAVKMQGTAQSSYELSKAKHEDMKKIHVKDAAIEDAYDFYEKNSGEKLRAADKGPTTPDVTPSSPVTPRRNSESQDSDETSDLPSQNYSDRVEQTPQSVKDRVEEVTGVDREPASDNGAPTEDDSALVDFFETNDSSEEKARRIKIENRITEIRAQIDKLKYERSITPDSEKYHELTKKINKLKEELESLKKQI